MKTNVCGEASGLKLSGLLSVLYTDGGEQTNLEGCTAKVPMIDGLKSCPPLEVLVVADSKDLEKPIERFHLVQDSVRLLVLPPKDECLGDLPAFEFENERRQKKQSRIELDERAGLLETRAVDYHRAVDSLATSIWQGLVAPKNPLDALDQPVADRIFEDIIPRTMAPAQAVKSTSRPFIKKWRSVTRDDLLWKQHLSPQEVNSKMHEPEYNDLMALNNI
ncbi:hypothetical protein GNI_119500, partial [Gregarina niphandrodes]